MTTAPEDLLHALSDPTRRQVLDLVAAEPCSASALARHLPVSRAAILKHVTVLERTGLVSRQRRGREVFFEVRSDRLRETADWLTTLADAWDGRLDALRRLAEDG